VARFVNAEERLEIIFVLNVFMLPGMNSNFILLISDNTVEECDASKAKKQQSSPAQKKKKHKQTTMYTKLQATTNFTLLRSLLIRRNWLSRRRL